MLGSNGATNQAKTWTGILYSGVDPEGWTLSKDVIILYVFLTGMKSIVREANGPKYRRKTTRSSIVHASVLKARGCTIKSGGIEIPLILEFFKNIFPFMT